MAGDGFVRMPGEPERWVRLEKGGYRLRVPYRLDDREDLKVAIEASPMFRSPLDFSHNLRDLVNVFRRCGIDDVLRVTWSSPTTRTGR